MGQVHTLPEMVINHIAAGEVVERPVSVVKELIENALDAQADTIRVAIQGAGVELIQVDDDGRGMDAEDAVLCFTRHATSKISVLTDLTHLTTLGFRGEALPSIATVSRVQMTSRCHEEVLGTRVMLEGGTVTSVEACGAPPGTSVRVQDLFYNTPARLKFLKHPSTEASLITHCFTGLALAAPSVHMTLHMNGRPHLQAPSVQDFGERLQALFGVGFQHNLLAVEHAEEGLQVQGYIAQATFHRATRRQQFFFVNGRLAQNRSLSHALYEAYRTLLPRDRHPVAFLFLTLPVSDIDVNVHPAKLEVRFRQEARLSDRLRRLLQQCLQASASGAGLSAPAPQSAEALPACRAVPVMWQAPHDGTASRRHSGSTTAQTPEAVLSPTLNLYAGYPQAGHAILAGHPLGQLHDTYILMPYPGGVVFVDQHAAHERVLYERLRIQMRDGMSAAQRLLFPATLDLGATEPEWVASCLPQLETLGFTLEPFGGNTYRLPSVPAVLHERDYAAALMDILEILRSPAADEVFEEGLPRVFHRMLTVMACHGAIRAHHRLQDDAIQALMRDLARTTLPFTCPHGRPVLLHIALAEIEKKFLRC